MALPVLAAALFAGTGIFKSQASRRKRRADRMRQEIKRIQNFQARRQFMNQFLTAQGNTLAAGAVSGAGLGSSGVQGQLASQGTQARVGMRETDRMDELDTGANRADVKASRLSSYGSLLGTAGNIAMMDF